MTDHIEYFVSFACVNLLTANAVFPHPGAKSNGVEIKDYRRPVLPLDPSTGFLEHLKYVVMFQYLVIPVRNQTVWDPLTL